ncbi:MAG: helix-turn-helix domain-containing protein [Bacteroidetes bacterium]|nr:helix-turn-helix domain-containing protein [Bacteroidota bacterium]MBL6944308.1 helix-turn-helix domain-containing protein [Bacteroidales bacterium]
MNNPFETLEQKLSVIEQKLDNLIQKIDDPQSSSPTWITSKQLAKYLGISTTTVNKLRSSKLPYYKLGGRIYFKKQEVDEWMEKTRHKSGGEYLNEYLGLR